MKIKKWEEFQGINENYSHSNKRKPQINPEIGKLGGDIEKITKFISNELEINAVKGYEAYQDLLHMHPEFKLTQKHIDDRLSDPEAKALVNLASIVRSSLKKKGF